MAHHSRLDCIMKLAGYQPQYFPRLHYFARILDAEVFAIADYVQFVKKHTYPPQDGRPRRGKSYQADTPIKTGHGVHHLAVPVVHEGLRPINQTHIDYRWEWGAEHLKSLGIHYARASHSRPLQAAVSELLRFRHSSLAALNIATTLWALAWILGEQDVSPLTLTIASINDLLQQPHPFRLRQIVLKSEIGVAPSDEHRDANTGIIETCQKVGADEYSVGGTASAAYIDAARFAAAGIKLVPQHWQCQSYRQRYPNVPFVPNLSILDLLANEDRACIQRVLHT